MDDLSVPLPDSLGEFVERQAAERGYRNPADYVYDLIRQAQRYQSEEHLEALLIQGLDSGDATEMTAGEWESIRSEVRAGR